MKRLPQDNSAPRWKFHIATFGCKVNQYESQALREAWEKMGGTECETPWQADVICVNSCAVTAEGERDARNAVYRFKRNAPTARLLLTGCAAKFFNSAAGRVGTQAKPDLVWPQEKKSLLLQTDPRKLPSVPPDREQAGISFPPYRISAFKRARPVIKVQDGCTHRCTYCVVPSTRGVAQSRPPADVLAESLRLLSTGCAEIMLSGINLRLYGRDNPDFGDFWDLLTFLEKNLAGEFAGQARFRISSLEPSQLNPKGLDTLAQSRMVCPHVHLSLQHVSRNVLKRMGRGHYTGRDVAEAVAGLYTIWPAIGLGADILVGFPGETENDLAMLEEFISEQPFSYAHVFPWSSRPGTPAAGFDGQIPVAVRQARAARVREAVNVRHEIFLHRQLGLERMLIAADSPKKDAPAKGVNEFYAPCLFRTRPASLSGLIPARPVTLNGKGLLVEFLDTANQTHSPGGTPCRE